MAETTAATTTAATTAAPANEGAVDLSGYQYDLVLTYKMIDDADDQDTLFRIQFLQAFGLTNDEYHPEIVSAVIDDLYERFRENPGIREIIESHPLFQPGTTTNRDDDGEDDRDDSGGETKQPSGHSICPNDNGEMIFCMMFSFQLFDLFHTCLRCVKRDEAIPESIRCDIAECFRTMF
jgi:hypothetical protein